MNVRKEKTISSGRVMNVMLVMDNKVFFCKEGLKKGDIAISPRNIWKIRPFMLKEAFNISPNLCKVFMDV